MKSSKKLMLCLLGILLLSDLSHHHFLKDLGIHPSAFYDKHLAQHLVLKQVKQLPSLVQQLAANVNKGLGDVFKSLPPQDNPKLVGCSFTIKTPLFLMGKMWSAIMRVFLLSSSASN
jgi:hypothetical protein